MATQDEINEQISRFCNLEITIDEAREIAWLLRQYYEQMGKTKPSIDANTCEQPDKWGMVCGYLSWDVFTIDQLEFDKVENALGTEVALQLYRLHLEERLKDNLPPRYLMPTKQLNSRIKSANLRVNDFFKLLDLSKKVSKIDKPKLIVVRTKGSFTPKSFVTLSRLKPCSIIHATVNDIGISMNFDQQDITLPFASLFGLDTILNTQNEKFFLANDKIPIQQFLLRMNSLLLGTLRDICGGCCIWRATRETNSMTTYLTK